MAQQQAHAQPQERPDLGPYPALHLYPGFTPCAGCGALLAWDKRASCYGSPLTW